MRALKVLVVVMGVMIIAGVVGMIVIIAQRLGGAQTAAGPAVLDEPTGTRIAGTSLSADRLAIQLQGGGPDRVVVIDLRTGRPIAQARLAP